ncbi:DUF2203 domain-containing protein [Brevibacillus sp. TJ4]|uniref:DUF2203 domain-containing protein n=1 Tax=Brevibacillus sp. TJ4 TaxID=3234853 RepID=UPI003B9ECCBF
MNKKIFTQEQANQLLPYVKEEISFLQDAKRRYFEAYRQREQVRKRQPVDEQELFDLECRLDFMEMEAQMRISRLTSQGIQVKDIDMGLVDFPSIIDGKEVLLCWKAGEESVSHYHGLHDGFLGRKPL